MEAAERDPPHVSSRKEEARKEEAEDGGVRVIVGGSVSRETEIHPLPSSAGPWVLIGFWGQNRQESLAREMNVPIIQLPAITKIGVIGGTSERRLGEAVSQK